MAEPRLRTTQKQRQLICFLQSSSVVLDICADIDTLLARVRELADQVTAMEQARTPLQAENTRLTLRNRELEGALGQTERELRRHASAHLQTIDERDDAENAFGHAYFLVTGQSPEWSNNFGTTEALQEIDDAQRLLREEIKRLEAEREGAAVVKLETLEELRDCPLSEPCASCRSVLAAAIRAAGGES